MSSYYQFNNPNREEEPARHMLVSDNILDPAPPQSSLFTTVEELRENLQYAIHLELTTIPPYLTALYSLKPGANEVSAGIIRSVVVEEMLHMVMAANLLNAIGGKPAIATETCVPRYPAPISKIYPHFNIELLKFSPAAIDIFLKIEKPAGDVEPVKHGRFHSIGQFYQAIIDGLKYVEAQYRTEGKTIFTGDHSLQVTADEYYGSGGELVAVTDLPTALLAIKEIVGQGEGIDGKIIDPDSLIFKQIIEFAHYYRFNEIACGKFYCDGDKANLPPTGLPFPVDWNAVYNMKPNPKLSDYQKGSELWNATNDFNKTYMSLLKNIEAACLGKPQLLREGIGLMYDLKYKAVALLNMPTGDGDYHAGPTFEFVED